MHLKYYVAMSVIIYYWNKDLFKSNAIIHLKFNINETIIEKVWGKTSK